MALRSRSLILVLVGALLAGSTGLLLTLHLHDGDAGHDSSHCPFCLVLLHPASAIAATAEPLIAQPAPARVQPAAPTLAMRSVAATSLLGPRAPPSMA